MLADTEQLQKTPEAALAQLMQEYGTRVLRLVTLFVKNRSLAEDITQDVFVKVYRKLPDFRGDSSVKTWIYAIAANECKMQMRSWSFRNLIFQSQVDRASEKSVEMEVVGESEREQLLAQVLALPYAYRQVIVLHYYEDQEIREIAAILGLREGTVRTRLHRARHMLKTALAAEEGGAEWISTSR